MNNYSEFQVNIYSNNRDIRKCQNFRKMLDDDEDTADDDARTIQYLDVFFENSELIRRQNMTGIKRSTIPIPT